MDIFNVLSMIGGLALFLFGMHAMGEGLSKTSGGRLEKILEKLTSNPIKAVLLGTGVTAVIQSSSATTVMVVGFVNSGVMKLSQAVGIIMGANIGTTVTSWILSLSGIESENFLIKLLKPSSFSPVLAIIGVAYILFSKREKVKDIGMILVGFSILMTGMDMMSAAVKPLADVPEFTNILTMFKNPLLGMLAGTVLTAIIQSSSASVGILQALCVTGSVSYAAAIPIIMGQNIGTCITAIMSSIGASKNAKRAALVHLYFNLIGTILFMVVFYSINLFVEFGFMKNSANAAGIAVVHSIFNLTATIILLPFSDVLEKLACITIRDDAAEAKTERESEAEKDFRLLDIRFLDTPGLATEYCRRVAKNMCRLTQEAIFTATDIITEYDAKKAERVKQLENEIDRYEDELGTYMVKLSQQHLSEKDSHELSIILHCLSDFERISDHAVNLVESSGEMFEKGQRFSKKAREELAVFTQAVRDIVEVSFNVFEEEDISKAELVEPLEEVIDYLQTEVKKRHVKRLQKGKCTIEMGFVLSDVITSYERISDHCSNIAVCLMQVKEDGYDTHEYLKDMKHNEIFNEQYNKYKEKYVLP